MYGDTGIVETPPHIYWIFDENIPTFRSFYIDSLTTFITKFYFELRYYKSLNIIDDLAADGYYFNQDTATVILKIVSNID